MTDCAICYEAVTAATGRSVMSCGHEFHMRCLVQWLQKPDGSGNCPCCRAEPSELERLVAAPVDSDDEDDDAVEGEEATGVTPLMDAARDGLLTEVRRLLTAGADLEAKDSDGDTALTYAVINNEDEVVTALLEAGADIRVLSQLTIATDSTESMTDELGAALLGACQYDCLPAVAAALAKGANPNYAHPDTGITPLMEIVRDDGCVEIVDILLARGANALIMDKDGWNTFMWFAEGSSDVDIMASLLTAHAPSLRPPKSSHVSAANKIQAFWRTRQAAVTLLSMMFLAML